MHYRDYYAYFENVADRLEDIVLFHEYDIWEFDTSMRTKKKTNLPKAEGFIFFLESYEATIQGEYMDNLRHRKRGSFSIVSKIISTTKGSLPFAKQKVEVLSKSEELVLQVLAQMKADKRNPNPKSPYRWLAGVNLSFDYFKMNGLVEGFYGWRVEFEMHSHAKLLKNPDLWK